MAVHRRSTCQRPVVAARGGNTGPAVAESERLSNLFAQVDEGLQSNPRRLPEVLFYDDHGAVLFEEITRLDEYYPTRVELEILSACVQEIRQLVGPFATMVEFGSGSGRKTELLLNSLDRPGSYLPVDISEAQLMEWADRIRIELPGVSVAPVVADFTRPFSFARVIESHTRGDSGPLFFFPGSSIGNFEPDAADRFLSQIGRIGGQQSSLLVGVDLVKEPEVLEAAYDDSSGVTAEFNRNALRHLNALFDGDFDTSSFVHRALWNAEHSRIEMRLVSTVEQAVTLHPASTASEPLRIRLGVGEEIVTEHSYKYHRDSFQNLCERAGWVVRQDWTDTREWFLVAYLERKDARK